MSSVGRDKVHRKRKRHFMFAQQKGRCHWCGCKMIRDWDASKKKTTPKNLATFDHLRDRFNPERQVPARNEQRIVLACWQCNFDRGRARQVECIDEQRCRSGHAHLVNRQKV